MNVEGKGDSIAVTSETAASGAHSLKVQDAPGLQYAFNPHFFYAPHHRQGRTRMEFDLRVEPGAIVHCEWRDDASPYRIGPSLLVRGGKLSAVGKDLLDLPTGAWTHFEIAAGLGPQSSGTWDLTVRIPGRDPTVFRSLPNGSPQWKKLDWLGFSSLATEKTVFYLDNIELASLAAEER